jgi:hypothetical protein
MSNIKKFEEMLDRLVNEDKEGAQELFHEIVVEKSRDIYESLLENDLDDEEVDEATDEEVEESDDEDLDEADDEEVEESDDEELDEDFNLDEFEVEADPMAAMGGDAGDDMMGDVEMPAPDAMDGGEEGEEELEDRVMDLEDALDDLKAEFDKMMSDEDGEGGEGDDAMDMDMDMDAPADDEAGDDDEEAEEAYAFEADEDEVEEGTKEPKSATEQMREYVEKVGGDNYKDFGKMGDNGANTKSTVAAKNDMGGTASNLVSGGEATSGNHAGLADINAKEENAGNVNTPGAKGATKMAGTKGHGAEKKGAGESGTNSKSTIGS